MNGPRRLADLTAGLVPTCRASSSCATSPWTAGLRAPARCSSPAAVEPTTVSSSRNRPSSLGASAVLYEETAGQAVPDFGSDIFVAAVPQLSQHVGTIADRFFGEPSAAVTVVGITGTNGKTTCAWLLAQALQHCGRPAAYMGTLGFGVPPAVTATEHTTSDAVTVHRHLAALRNLGAECVAMEVSSHAIDQSRVGAVRFNTAAFTNLTRDHLDYHGTMEAYGNAKARLFQWPTLANRVINADDAFGAKLAGSSVVVPPRPHLADVDCPRRRRAGARDPCDPAARRSCDRRRVELGQHPAQRAPDRQIQRRQRAHRAGGAARLGYPARPGCRRHREVPRAQRPDGVVRRHCDIASGDC